jgi:hypothetical protein
MISNCDEARRNGGPAFPSHGSMGEVVQQGMTLRDYFAAKAMQGLLADEAYGNDQNSTARWCYSMADAMLKARQE